MCGIAGIASDRGIPSPELAVAMSDTMRHRGPDGSGSWTSPDRRVALAHRRLAVIDLSPGGRQPMTDVSERYRIVFNGEIYNFRELRRELEGRGHRFRTRSDTEVILEAYREWGTACLEHLNGMFAFALYDSGSTRLFLARDRAGEKPLYYRHAGGTFFFASELKGLMADPAFPRVIDAGALDHYLAYGCVPGGTCILAGVRKLEAARALIYDLAADEVRPWTYWTVPTPSTGPPPDRAELLEEFSRLLENSVRLRMIADVPVGILLSGGIDSSLVTAMAARVSSAPVKTFTVTFPGQGHFDEGPHARIVAEHFGTDHAELVAEPASVELLPLLARQFDEPIGDHSIIPTYLVSRLIRRHATVALGGDGGDELFAGYPHYGYIQRMARLRRFLPGPMGRIAGSLSARFLPVGTTGRNHLIGLGGDLSRSIAHVNMYFDARTRERLRPSSRGRMPRGGAPPERYRERFCAPGATPLRQATAADFATTLVDDYLVKVDRASMLASLEVRAPFLDHRLVEFAFGRVPDRLRATGSERKILPRELARRLLPDTLDLTRKHGFELPLARWFEGRWGEYVRDVLGNAPPGFFDRRVVAELVAGQEKGYANANRLFLLTMFELWRREYGAEIPGGTVRGGEVS